VYLLFSVIDGPLYMFYIYFWFSLLIMMKSTLVGAILISRRSDWGNLSNTFSFCLNPSWSCPFPEQFHAHPPFLIFFSFTNWSFPKFAFQSLTWRYWILQARSVSLLQHTPFPFSTRFPAPPQQQKLWPMTFFCRPHLLSLQNNRCCFFSIPYLISIVLLLLNSHSSSFFS